MLEKGNGQKTREPSKLLVRCRIPQRVNVKFLVSLFVRLFYVVFELRKVENKDVGNSTQDSTFATIVYWNRELNLSKNGLYSPYNPLFISSQRKKSKYIHNIHTEHATTNCNSFDVRQRQLVTASRKHILQFSSFCFDVDVRNATNLSSKVSFN